MGASLAAVGGLLRGTAKNIEVLRCVENDPVCWVRAMLWRWMLIEEGVDLGVFCFGEAEGCGGGDAFDLFGVAAADDGCGDGGVVERPSDRDDSGGDVVASTDLF